MFKQPPSIKVHVYLPSGVCLSRCVRELFCAFLVHYPLVVAESGGVDRRSSLGCRSWTAFVNAIFLLEPFAHDLLSACSDALLFARNSMVSGAFPSGSPFE
jgi:hypothetical protein